MVLTEEPALPKEEALQAETVLSGPTAHPPGIHQAKNAESAERSRRPGGRRAPCRRKQIHQKAPGGGCPTPGGPGEIKQ